MPFADVPNLVHGPDHRIPDNLLKSGNTSFEACTFFYAVWWRRQSLDNVNGPGCRIYDAQKDAAGFCGKPVGPKCQDIGLYLIVDRDGPIQQL